MALSTTRALLEQHATDGILAFNIITLEHAEAVVRGAEAAERPAILQVSENAVHFHGGDMRPLMLAAAAIADSSRQEFALHLDHIESMGLLQNMGDLPISSAMFDASKLEYEDNVLATAEAVRWGHDHGLLIEAELGAIGGKEGAHAPGVRTDPGEAERFVLETGVDALAVAVGSTHAMTSRTAQLDLGLIEAIAARVPVPLVLHGSSGVPDRELIAAIRAGMVKINIGTLLNVAFTRAVRDFLAENDSIDPRGYLRRARDAVSDAVEGQLRAIG